MTDLDLEQQRRHKWRLDGRPVRTLEDAVQFIGEVGFCTMYPLRPPVLLPTFLGAWAGEDARLPTWQHAFADTRSGPATELMVRLLREKAAFEANLFGETNFLVAANVFPYFYALVGDRTPQRPFKPGRHQKASPLAQDAFAVIQNEGPISRARMMERLAGGISQQALDRALNDLWSVLRITRVDYRPEDGAFWDVMDRWAPEPVREGINLSVAEGLSALLTKYLECVIAAEPRELEEFFSHLVGRSKVRDAVGALLSARELSFVPVGGRSLVQITPARQDPQPRRRPEARKKRA
jgi:hypothetical protein